MSLLALTPQLESMTLSLSKASISLKSALPTPIIMTLIGVLEAATSAACVGEKDMISGRLYQS